MRTISLIVLLVLNIALVAAQKSYKYDLYIDLYDIRAVKVDEGPFGDNNEDIYGLLGIYDISIYKRPNFVELFGQTTPKKVSTEYVPFEKRAHKIADMTFGQLMDLKFYIGGDISDNEDLINDPRYETIDLAKVNRRPISFNDPNNRGEIERMKPKPNNTPRSEQYQIIKGGSDNFWQMDYFENGDNRKSHIRIRWQFSLIVKN